MAATGPGVWGLGPSSNLSGWGVGGAGSTAYSRSGWARVGAGGVSGAMGGSSSLVGVAPFVELGVGLSGVGGVVVNGAGSGSL